MRRPLRSEAEAGAVGTGGTQDALRAGASGFLAKDTPPAELASAIRTLAAGDALTAPRMTVRHQSGGIHG